MAIEVLTGKRREVWQRKFEKDKQRGELYARARELCGQYSVREGMDLYFCHRGVGSSPDWFGSEMRSISNNNPVSSLALIDLIEVLIPFRKDAESFELFVWARDASLKLFHDRTYTLKGKVIHAEPYSVAGAMTAACEKIKMTYGRKIMADIQLKVEVVEAPVYISPRAQLTALEAAQRSEETGLAAAAQDYEEESIQEGEVIY